MNTIFNIDKDNRLELTVPEGVFTPTGTSEVLIQAVHSYIKKPGKTLDLGCGSGVVGISLHKLGLVDLPIYASDLSQAAVEAAKTNAAAHNCAIEARFGAIFDPWKNEKFDYIVDDIAGIAEAVAEISPWYNGISCKSGKDGADLVVEVLKQAPKHLKDHGALFFPIISFSNVERILRTARENFVKVEQLVHKEWVLPKEMYQDMDKLKELQEKGLIQIIEKFGMVLWFTDIYVARRENV